MTLRHTWEQPICPSCWDQRTIGNPDPPESKVVDGPVEKCCVCGAATYDGIVARINPVSVKFPRMVEV